MTQANDNDDDMETEWDELLSSSESLAFLAMKSQEMAEKFRAGRLLPMASQLREEEQ